MQTFQYKPLLLILFPQRTIVRQIALILAGSWLVALAAQVSIPLPFTPVPITGQTFGVALVGATLGMRLGFLSLVTYLVQGAAGMPVFAPGAVVGLARLLGPTGGYLMAFPLAAALIGYLVERFGSDRKFLPTMVAMLAGDVVTFTLGTIWLSVNLATAGKFPGVWPVLGMAVIPFLPGSLIKASLAACGLPIAWRLIGTTSPPQDEDCP